MRVERFWDANKLITIFCRLHREKITTSARVVWDDPDVANAIGENALYILFYASKSNLKYFFGKCPKCILAGLFYILGIKHNEKKTQKEIADLLCTTETSIRKTCNSWLNEFPELFSDIN